MKVTQINEYLNFFTGNTWIGNVVILIGLLFILPFDLVAKFVRAIWFIVADVVFWITCELNEVGLYILVYFSAIEKLYVHKRICINFIAICILCTLSIIFFNGVDALNAIIRTIIDKLKEDGDKFIVSSITVQIAFYYFVLKEQKSIADTSIKVSEWNIKTSTLVYLIVLGSLSGIMANNAQLERTITFMPCILIVLLIWYFCNMIGIFRRVEPIYLTGYLIFRFTLYASAIEKCLTHPYFSNNKYVPLKQYSKDLVYSVTAVYQSLLYLSQRDMIGIFNEKYSKWKGCMAFLMLSSKDSYKADYACAFAEISVLDYFAYYRAGLRGQLALIKALYKNSYFSEGRKALEDFFEMRPTVPPRNARSMTNEYLIILLQIALFFYKENISLVPIMNSMRKLNVNEPTYDGIIVFYRAMMIKATEAQDEKMMIRLSYGLINAVDSMLKPRGIVTFLSGNKYLLEKCHGRIVYVCLSAIVKCIELGYKDIAAFLVKFIVSNFNWELIESSLKKFVEQSGADSKYDEHEISVGIGISSFSIDVKTCPYCIQKASILIYGQQEYVRSNKVEVGRGETNGDSIKISSYANKNNEYIANKLFKESYKLIWMTDEKFKEDYVHLLSYIDKNVKLK